MHAIEVLLRQHWRSFAVSQISRGRANQLRNFMRMLKLCAIDLNDRIRVAIQNFRRGLNHASFSRAGWAQKNHGSNWTVWRIHTSQKNLVKAAHTPHGALLSDDASGKPLLEVLGRSTLLIRIQEDCAHGLV